MSLDAQAPIWWKTFGDDTRLVLELETGFRIFSLPDFRELARIDKSPGSSDCESSTFSQANGTLAWVSGCSAWRRFGLGLTGLCNELHVWSLGADSPPENITLPREVFYPYGMNIAPDGGVLAVSDDVELLVFDLGQRRLRFSARPPPVARPSRSTAARIPEESVFGLAPQLDFFAGGTVLLVGWERSGTVAYTTDSGTKLADFGRGWLRIWRDEEERTLLTWSNPGPIQRFAIPSGPRQTLWGAAVCRAGTLPRVDRKGAFVACGTNKPEAKLFDLRKRTLVTTIPFEGESSSDYDFGAVGARAEELRFTPDGAGLLVSVGYAGAPSGVIPHRRFHQVSGVVDPHTRLYRVPGGELVEDLGRALLLQQEADDRLFLFDVHKRELITVAPGPSVRRVPLALPAGALAGWSQLRHCAISSTGAVARDGSRLVVVSRERLYLVTTADGGVTPLEGAPTSRAEDGIPATLAGMDSFFSRDGRLLFGMMRNHAAAVWETERGRLLFTARGQLQRSGSPYLAARAGVAREYAEMAAR